MKLKAFHAVALAACALPCFLNTSSHSAEGQPASAKSSFPSEAELKQVIPTGLSKAELIRRFGEPFVSVPKEHGTEMLVYQKPESQHIVPAKFAYSGFSVTLTNGKVAQVGASHYSVTTNRWFGSSQAQEVNTNRAASQTYNTNLTASIVIHVVSDEAFPGGRHLDTKLLPKNSYIRDQPDLVVKAIKEVTRGQEVFGTGSKDFREILAVTLTEADAKRLARLTEQSVGQRVLISVGTEPVSAPVVQIPIQTGRFTLVVQTAEDASRIFEQLRGLIPK